MSSDRTRIGAGVAVVAGCAAVLAGCGGGPTLTRLPSGQPTSSGGAAAAANTEVSACRPAGTTTVDTMTSAKPGGDGESAAVASFMSAAFTTAGAYLNQAWPQGQQTYTTAGSWVSHLMLPGSPLIATLQKGPQGAGSWTGGQPDAAQAASYAYDERFLMWKGGSNPYLQQWQPVTVTGRQFQAGTAVGTVTVAANALGTPLMACIPWAVQFESQLPQGSTWWYVTATMAVQPTAAGTTAVVNPEVKGGVYSQPAGAGPAPDWVASSTGASHPPAASKLATIALSNS